MTFSKVIRNEPIELLYCEKCHFCIVFYWKNIKYSCTVMPELVLEALVRSLRCLARGVVGCMVVYRSLETLTGTTSMVIALKNTIGLLQRVTLGLSS